MRKILTMWIVSVFILSSITIIICTNDNIQAEASYSDYCVYYSCDEGEGQFIYDETEGSMNASDDRLTLGLEPEADIHDPLWGSDCQDGFALFFDKENVSIVHWSSVKTIIPP